MSIRAIPLLFFVFLLYNVVVLLFGGDNPGAFLREPRFPLPVINGQWSMSIGDIIVLILLVLLFLELLKATYTSSTSLLDHGLSMIVFVVCLVEFLMVSEAQTSVFFFIVIATFIDVIAGYTIGIRLARRDINFEGEI